jgi:Ca-activated chloride channel family protein
MLVMDISLSMLADDISPDRITAAKEAGIRFVSSLPKDVRVGLELFAGNNYVVSPPTSKHAEIAAYLRNLQKEDLKQRTEIGTALQTALKILSTEEAIRLKKNPKDKHKPDQVIILLSDGDSHEGYPWDLAAQNAKKQHVTIHTVAIGKEESTSITYNNIQLPVLFSETTLRRIAVLADGEFFRVFQRDDFRKIYDRIRQRSVHYEERTVDIGFVFSGLALLVLIAGLLATARFIRPLW